MRRLIDILVSFTALLLLSPLLVAVAIAIAVESPGSPLYLAQRVGQYGVRFRMWKFRTMVKDAAKVGPSITGNRDPRITRLGAFLRKTKIDEIPQLVNVFKGEMTLVGPRPEAPDIVDQYSERQRAVLLTKPGVTGKVQLESGEESESIPPGVDPGKYYVEVLMAKKIQTDLDYLQRRNGLTDLQIVLSTIAYILKASPLVSRR